MLKAIELSGFKSFAKKGTLTFTAPVSGIVGPNGSGKSNVAEAFRFVLGEQSMKALRGKRGPDLIWSGNERAPRANRARVAAVFDNRNKLLDIDFDEVVVERIVHRDGAHEYAINGSKTRLKDIIALLSSANIGASGHHIISQGEADRILGASPKERRDMIEEALGLKTYQFKKAESEKKLATTAENMKEVASLRREIKPHLTFLERQMKKLERSRELKRELKHAYGECVAHERAYIRAETQRITTERTAPTAELERITKQLESDEEESQHDEVHNEQLAQLDERMRAVVQEKGKLEHARGRIEGQIALIDETPEEQPANEQQVPLSRVQSLFAELEALVHRAIQKQDLTVLDGFTAQLKDFLAQFKDTSGKTKNTNKSELAQSLNRELKEVEESYAALESEESAISVARADMQNTITEHQKREKENQQQYFKIHTRRKDLEHELDMLKKAERTLAQTREQLTRLESRAQDVGVETGALEPVVRARPREEQQDALRTIERIEARLEESGVVDDDTVREYEETQERDAFLEREMSDLEQSKTTLENVIRDLDQELCDRFTEGLKHINTEFNKFFSMLFGGGEARLSVVKHTRGERESDEGPAGDTITGGVEIQVQLPRKKVTTLEVLSGGERALTSIALIFAMSQVNPPPFIILDETDAALDEANSRKYANMVRALAEHSQLILITHNRQTMEATGELYGVTMGSDGISKLLSVKFDEAVAVAK